MNLSVDVSLISLKFHFYNHCTHLPSPYVFSVIPALLEDSRRVMETWGKSGTFDPFEKIYEVRTSD
jgi:hypothetical protein